MGTNYFRDLTKTDAFGEYGANLNNPVNEYSAVANDGSVVLECWTHLIDDRRTDGCWRYQVQDFATWNNVHGKDLLMKHVKYALAADQPVRLVLATPKAGAKPAVAGIDGTKIPKTISIRRNRIGTVIKIDEAEFVMDFLKV